MYSVDGSISVYGARTPGRSADANYTAAVASHDALLPLHILSQQKKLICPVGPGAVRTHTAAFLRRLPISRPYELESPYSMPEAMTPVMGPNAMTCQVHSDNHLPDSTHDLETDRGPNESALGVDTKRDGHICWGPKPGP